MKLSELIEKLLKMQSSLNINYDNEFDPEVTMMEIYSTTGVTYITSEVDDDSVDIH